MPNKNPHGFGTVRERRNDNSIHRHSAPDGGGLQDHLIWKNGQLDGARVGGRWLTADEIEKINATGTGGPTGIEALRHCLDL